MSTTIKTAMNILVVGGAGYVGSHVNRLLVERGYNSFVYDNLSYGHKDAVICGEFILGDTCDEEKLIEVLVSKKIDAVMHFASFISVGESVEKPYEYYLNNTLNTLTLLKAMIKADVKNIVFSSTAATFGNPRYKDIDEEHPQEPINPYGMSKLMVEHILKDFQKAYGINYSILRYFNVSGASLDSQIGENHNPETHLIPLILDAACGRREDIKVYGDDYDTPDGTCIRDYIHVLDLADAHILALEYLTKEGKSDSFNLGNGNGYSVLEVINSVKNVTGNSFKVSNVERREGDPAVLVASSKKAKEILNWKPQFYELDTIVETAWNWHLKLYNIKK